MLAFFCPLVIAIITSLNIKHVIVIFKLSSPKSIWTGQFENNNKMKNVKDVISAIINGQKQSNLSR